MLSIKTKAKTNANKIDGRKPYPVNDKILDSLKKQWPLYIMVLPGIIYFILFKFVPLAASIIAFQDYSLTKGVFGSPWAGLKYFRAIIEYPELGRVFWNTVVIAFLSLVFTFPVPIIFALLLNEVKNKLFKGAVQTFSYLPYFFSWVIVAGMAFDILSSQGIVNNLRQALGMDAILFIQEEKYFRPLIVLSSIWKETGWGSIVILAAISGINPEYYEAAVVDGASKFRQVWNITLPLLLPTLIILFLLRIGSFLDLGFDQIYNFLTPMTYSVGDVIATYVYRVGITEGQYSLTTAVGLLQSVIGFILVVLCNKLSNKVSEGGLW